MSRIILLLAFVAVVAAQSCETCSNPLSALATTIEVCGDSELRTYRALDFNLVALGAGPGDGNIASEGGDVEGRLLANNDFTVTGGFSVGDKIVNYPANAPWNQKNFSIIVGGSILQWKSGQINPFKDDPTHRAETGVYFGPTNNAPSYLPITQCTGGLDLSELRTDLQAIATAQAAAADNVRVVPMNNGQILELTGDSASLCNYHVTITVDEWNSKRGFALMQWNYGANVIVNIECPNPLNGMFLFEGAEFPGLAENILYNFGPSCEDLIISANSVHGSILAPWSDLQQADGRVWGNVFVRNVDNFLQINVIDCPPNPESCDCCNLCA